MAKSTDQLTPLADLINGKNVATVGALPAAGDFLGERVFITGTKQLATWNGTAWVLQTQNRADTFTSPSAAADTNTFVDVTFTTPFVTGSTPFVTVELMTALPAAPVTHWITNKSETGFRFNVRRAGGALGSYSWDYIALVP